MISTLRMHQNVLFYNFPYEDNNNPVFSIFTYTLKKLLQFNDKIAKLQK